MQTRLSQMSIAASGYTDDHTRFDMNNEPLLSTLVPNHSPLSTGSSAPIGFDGQNVPAHFFLNLAPTRPFSIGPAFNPLDEVRASCMNPLVMARNALLQGIVERAQRSYLRDKLEILVANPYHVPITQRAPATNSNANFYPRPQSGLANYENVMRNNSYQTYLRDNPNPPTMVLQGGLDSAAVLLPDGVFTPYVSFNYFDISTQTPVAMNPSATGGNPRDSLIARSLRDCDHLYSQANGRQKPNDATLNNALFEPAMLSVFTQVPFTRLGTYAPGLDPWDRPIVLNPFNLTAGMFVATLGTGQICANGEVQPGSYPPITDPYERQITCQKPDRILNLNLPPSDLRGDLRAALRFVANGTPDAYAITGAGFFPGWPRIANPFNTTSHILIVTHQRITLGEANVLQRLVDQIMTNQPGRAFTVIYMPTNEIDASSNPAFPVTGPPPLPVLGGPPPPPEYAVDLFRRAFRTSNTWCVGDGSAPAASRDPSTGSCRNVLIVLAPRAGGIWNPDVTFRRYWADLIVGTPRSFVPIGGYWPGADIRSLAQRIFTRRLRVERLKS